MSKVEVQTLPAGKSCDGCVLKTSGACSARATDAPVPRRGRPDTGTKKQAQSGEFNTPVGAPITERN